MRSLFKKKSLLKKKKEKRKTFSLAVVTSGPACRAPTPSLARGAPGGWAAPGAETTPPVLFTHHWCVGSWRGQTRQNEVGIVGVCATSGNEPQGAVKYA